MSSVLLTKTRTFACAMRKKISFSFTVVFISVTICLLVESKVLSHNRAHINVLLNLLEWEVIESHGRFIIKSSNNRADSSSCIAWPGRIRIFIMVSFTFSLCVVLGNGKVCNSISK